MRFFCDECCPRPLARALATRGHDVIHALDVSRSATDAAQALLALSQQRIVISSDYDFGELAVRRMREFIGLVLLAPRSGGLGSHAEELAQRIDAEGVELMRMITILEKDLTRRRELPR